MRFEKYHDKKLKGVYWRFDATIGGKRYRHGQFLYKKDAEDAVAALRVFCQKLRYGLPTPEAEVTLGDLLAKVSKDKTVPTGVRSMLALFVSHCGEKRMIRTLGRADIKSFADSLRETRTLADSSYSQYLAQLKSALYRAGDYYNELETWQPPKLPKLPGFRRRTRIVTQAELAPYLRELSKPVWHADRDFSFGLRQDLADKIRLMCLLGARREEVEKIKVSAIDWDERTLWLWSSKTKREHLVPLSNLAVTVLKSRPLLKTGKLFATHQEPCDVTHTMTKATAQIGDGKYGRKKGGWTLHDLRRTAAVLVENAGIPYSAVQDLLGHRRQDMTATYTPAQMAALRQGVEVLERWCRDIDGFFIVAGELHSTPATSTLKATA